MLLLSLSLIPEHRRKNLSVVLYVFIGVKYIYGCSFCAGKLKTVEFRGVKNGGKRSAQNIGANKKT